MYYSANAAYILQHIYNKLFIRETVITTGRTSTNNSTFQKNSLTDSLTDAIILHKKKKSTQIPFVKNQSSSKYFLIRNVKSHSRDKPEIKNNNNYAGQYKF